MNKDAPSYIAHAFHPSRPNEVIDGRIIFTVFSVLFEHDGGTVGIPLKEVKLAIGHGDDERLFFRHAAQPDWNIFTPDYEILNDRIFVTNSRMRSQVHALFGKQAYRKLLITTMSGIGIVAFVLLSIFWLAARSVRAAVDNISPETEQELGDDLYADIKQHVPLSQDPVLIEQLNGIFQQLRPGLPNTNMTVHFHIVETDTPNAASIPGHVFVTRGLFSLLGTRQEMAGVLGHEVGHITEKHVFRQIISSKGPARLLRLAFGHSGSAAGDIIQGSQFVLGRSFSRDNEREADDAGWKSLVAAGIDPRGMIDSLTKLKAWSDAHEIIKNSEILSTHPAPEKRIQRLESHWSDVKQQSGFVNMSQPLRQTAAPPTPLDQLLSH